MKTDAIVENTVMVLTAAACLADTATQEWSKALAMGAAFTAWALVKVYRKQRDLWKGRAMATLELAQDAATVAVKASRR